MNAWSARRARELTQEDLCGFVFKKKSPSCGLERLGVRRDDGNVTQTGRGLFAAAFTRAHPLVPAEEEGRLHDPRIRENFLERVFAYRRVKDAFAGRPRRGAIVAFHSREKYLLLSHSPRRYKELGRLVAGVADHAPGEFRDAYVPLFMEALAVKATTRRHLNALQHIAGHLRGVISPEEQKRVLAVIEEYGAGLTPLIVPMTLLKHYVELHEVPYVVGADLPEPAPQGADAPQPRLGSHRTAWSASETERSVLVATAPSPPSRAPRTRRSRAVRFRRSGSRRRVRNILSLPPPTRWSTSSRRPSR